MATKIPRIKFFNSVVKNKMPEAETSSIGELFINANAERPFISTKDSNGDMKKVIFEDEINAEIKSLAEQYQMDEAAVRSALSDDMLKHDIAVRKVVDEIADSAKQTRDAKKDEE